MYYTGYTSDPNQKLKLNKKEKCPLLKIEDQ